MPWQKSLIRSSIPIRLRSGSSMTNFRLNLPVDIPWKLIDSSPDMTDRSFCDKRSPNPFRPSLAIYACAPKAEELPEELCGDQIAYLKISCTIAGFQPTEDEK